MNSFPKAVIGALNAAMLRVAALPLAVGAAVAAAAAILLTRLAARETATQEGAALRNPFDLRVAVGFALFLGAMELASRALAERLGSAGAFAAALVAGIGDVDAVVISVAKLAPLTLNLADAGIAALVAVAANTLGKLAIGIAVGGRAFALPVAAATAAALLAGGIAWFAISRGFGG